MANGMQYPMSRQIADTHIKQADVDKLRLVAQKIGLQIFTKLCVNDSLFNHPSLPQHMQQNQNQLKDCNGCTTTLMMMDSVQFYP